MVDPPTLLLSGRAVSNLHRFNNYTSQHIWKIIQEQSAAIERRFHAYRTTPQDEPNSRETKVALFDDMRQLQCLSDHRLSESKRLVAAYMQAMSEQNMALAQEIQAIKAGLHISSRSCRTHQLIVHVCAIPRTTNASAKDISAWTKSLSGLTCSTVHPS